MTAPIPAMDERVAACERLGYWFLLSYRINSQPVYEHRLTGEQVRGERPAGYVDVPENDFSGVPRRLDDSGHNINCPWEMKVGDYPGVDGRRA